MRRLLHLAILGALACRHSYEPANPSIAPDEEPPVALNAEPTVQYPPDLYDRHVEGDVVLQLYADSSGKIVAESTRVAESSGNAKLDTAAVHGVPRLRYAPAYRHGVAIATAFLQTVEFRHPEAGVGPVAPAAVVATPSATPAPRPVRSDTTPVRSRSDTTTIRRNRDTTRALAPRPAPAAAPDTTRVRRDTTPPVRDTTPVPDSTTVRRDST